MGVFCVVAVADLSQALLHASPVPSRAIAVDDETPGGIGLTEPRLGIGFVPESGEQVGSVIGNEMVDEALSEKPSKNIMARTRVSVPITVPIALGCFCPAMAML